MEDDGGYIVMTKLKVKDPTLTPKPMDPGTSHHRCHYKAFVPLLPSLLLVSAVIFLSVYVFQACSDTHFKATLAQLKQSLCDPAQDDLSAESECKLCPKNWIAHGEKCYWLSKKSWVWNESKKDCEVRRAQMLIIQDLEEMDFISNITEGTNHVWIGLHLPLRAQNWIWVDGAPLDQLMFKVLGNMDSESCGVVKANRINSETCQAEFKWICEREAIEM